MKAIRIHEDGGPEVLRYEDVPDPEPADGEVLIELRAASLNHLDVWIRKGLPSVPKPRILGADGAGVIAGTDERVVINPGIVSGGKTHIVGETMDGTHAELIAIPRDFVHPIPGDLSFEEAAAFPLVFETAYRMLVHRARLQAGEWVLIWGIGGGVATAALSLAKALGAQVVVTSSSDEKLQQARELGADATVNHATDDVVAHVKEVTSGGAHVVVDDVGEATWKRTLDAARVEGRVVVCGATTGPNPPAALHRVWWKQLSILGSTMGTPDDFKGAYDLIAAGKARPVVDMVFPLADARLAHDRLEAGEQLGKIVLSISARGLARGGDGRCISEALPRRAAAERDAHRAQAQLRRVRGDRGDEVGHLRVEALRPAHGELQRAERPLVVAGEVAHARRVGGVGGRERPVGRPPLVQLGERVVHPSLERQRERPRAMAVVVERARVALEQEVGRATQRCGVACAREAPGLVSVSSPGRHRRIVAHLEEIRPERKIFGASCGAL